MTVNIAPKTHTPISQGDGTWKTTAQGSVTWAPNKPSGLTEINRSFATATDGTWWTAGSTAMSIVSTTSLYDDGNGLAGRVIYPPGHPGGEDAPSGTGYTWAGNREVYLCFDLRLSANWQPHPTGTNKIFYLTNNGTGNPAFLSFETELSPRQIVIRNQGIAVPASTSPNLATVEFVPGNNYMIECRLVSNTAAGVANGEAHLWVNGVKTTQHTGLQWNASNFNWEQVAWLPIWGGGGSTVTNSMFQEISRLTLGYKS